MINDLILHTRVIVNLEKIFVHIWLKQNTFLKMA